MELEAKAPSATKRPTRLACALLGALALLCGLASHASAAYYDHPFVSEFGPDGTATSKFQQDRFLAVDQASHDVYVVDLFANRIYRFTSSGAPHDFSEGEAAGRNWLTFNLPPSVTASVIKGIAVAPAGAAAGTAGDVYVAWNGQSLKNPAPYSWGVEIYSPNGAHLGTLDGSGNPHHFPTELGLTTRPCGVAVDPAGNVYVSNCSSSEGAGEQPSHVDKYVPTANPVKNANFDSEIFGLDNSSEFYSLAASGTTLYTVGFKGGLTFPLSLFPGGGGSADVSGKGTPSPAANEGLFTLDRSSDDLYVVGMDYDFEFDGGQLHQFVRRLDKAGEELALINVPDAVRGVAVDEASGRVFVSNYVEPNEGANRVRIYGPPVLVPPPSATIDTPSSVTYKSAHFSGTVNPSGSGEGFKTIYRFECSPSCPGLFYDFRQHSPRDVNRELPGDGQDHVVSDDASGLTAETKYEVKLIATNAHGHQTVEDTTSFETAAKPPLTAPVVTIDPVSEITGESAHLSGTVDPMGTGLGQATTYRFEYSSDGVKWIPLADQGPIEGSGPQPVSTQLEGLVPNASYSVRLHAVNDGGEDTSDAPNPAFTTLTASPQVEILQATDVLQTSAQINGQVNPRNSQTTYYFQWGSGDCATSSCASIPASQDAEAGSGVQFVSVHAQLQDLSPTTTYHYRLIAESPAGKTSTGDASFTTEANPAACTNQRSGPSATLPQCRAYEMVSPLEKAGGDVASLPFRTRAAADGNAISFVSQAGFAGTEGFPYSGAEYLALRSADGWSTHSITPLKKSPALPSIFSASAYIGRLSPDLETGIYRALAPSPELSPNVAGATNLLLATGIRAGTPHFTLLSDSVNPLGDQPTDPAFPHISLVGASADFSHVFFQDTDNLTADTSGTGQKLYEWADGQLRLAGVLPDSACGSPPCIPGEAVGGASASGGTSGQDTDTELAHAVSRDGSKVFFTAGSLAENAGGDLGREGSLYVREDGTHTTQIDASERSTPDPKGPGRSEFQWASPNGDEVLFFSKEKLVDEDTEDEGAALGAGISLYRWRASAPAGERLTVIPTPGVRPAHIVSASADGAFVYLLDRDTARTVYVLHGGQMRKVVTLGGGPKVGEKEVAFGTARMTPDGRRLFFYSRQSLTGYDNVTHNPGCEDFSNEKHCTELYQYSYDADEIACASCDPSGEPPSGDAPSFDLPEADSGVSGGSATWVNNNPISADGRYVFFTSPDGLVAQDSNGRYDAYVYDVARHEVRLLSSGQCNCNSIFLTASPSGHDVFITTRQQLVRVDTDNLSDLYDVRVDGGIASQNALPPNQCQGDACQPTPSVPDLTTPGSAGFSGPANPQAKQAKKAKKHRKKRHRKRASAVRKANSDRRAGR